MRRLPLLLLAVALSSTAACELVTHAFDFRVGSAAAAGICAACPAGADLRRPPCSVADAAPDLDRSFVFAARRSRLGSAADAASAHLDLGVDLDCSAAALPSLCVPRSPNGWARLPHGIDDALLARVIAPAQIASPPGRAVDLDGVVSSALEAGRYGVVVSVRRWNGLPDDPSVEVTLRSSPGLASGLSPAWAGGDVWAPYPDVDDDGVRRLAVDRAEGYVAGGTLVVDARALGASLLRFGPRGASFDLLVGDLVITAALSAGRLDHFTLAGVLDQPSTSDAATALSGALGACAGGIAGPFFASFPPLVALAADMPFPPGGVRGDFCNGISFAWSLDAEPALLAGQPGDGGAGVVGCP